MISPSLRHLLRVYALEAKYECVKQLRLPTQLIFSMGFPLMFYTVFGLLFGRGGGAGSGSFALFYIATYGAFGIVTAALYGFGVGVATERGQGWMLLKRASPMPYAAYFIGKLAMSLASAASIVALLTASGVLVMGVRVSPIAWCEMAALLILGSMPMAMLSGLWIPLNVLPAFVRSIARFLPAYHYSQLALATIGQNQPGSIAGHVLALVGFTIPCLALAYAGYRRDEDKTYG